MSEVILKRVRGVERGKMASDKAKGLCKLADVGKPIPRACFDIVAKPVEKAIENLARLCIWRRG
ncbi:hypothetical protein IMZ48_42795 [Candidatus Bathyarchaeota archaeon]|nr:hypothetical protein [Candidatus Bathyarchaeota archaeon]